MPARAVHSCCVDEPAVSLSPTPLPGAVSLVVRFIHSTLYAVVVRAVTRQNCDLSRSLSLAISLCLSVLAPLFLPVSVSVDLYLSACVCLSLSVVFELYSSVSL
jgi:hypothetical protein